MLAACFLFDLIVTLSIGSSTGTNDPSSACLIPPSSYSLPQSYLKCSSSLFFEFASSSSASNWSQAASLAAISDCFFSSSFFSSLICAFDFRLYAEIFMRWPLIPLIYENYLRINRLLSLKTTRVNKPRSNGKWLRYACVGLLSQDVVVYFIKT